MNLSHLDNKTRDIASTIYQYAAIVGLPPFIFGLLINLFLLYIFLFDSFFQKTTYKLIRVSVISDIISTITSIIGYAQIVSHNVNFNEGEAICRVALYLMMSSYGISMMNLCLIGFDRYLAVVKPFSSLNRRYKNRILITAEILIWLISLSITIPILSLVTVHHNDTMLCDTKQLNLMTKIFLLTLAVILYIIPSLAISFTYGKIIAFQRSYKRPGEILNYRSEQEGAKKKRFIRMLISITASYILLSWPFFAAIIGIAITSQSIMMIRRKSIVYFLLLLFSITATTSISILNPLIYLKFDVNIRKRSWVMLTKMQIFQCKSSYSISKVESLQSKENLSLCNFIRRN
ncbi:Proteinase-activated receptor 2 [Trichoplax sp. H2]|nr:Proteinase-activated receptor 2 [Trichoplax sp. H2]|eukprot:RDD41374.1 Proteinase-activated receptor 2 [Trichoplax sp. H2]